MKEARHSAAAVLGHDGHIYVFGGFNTQPLSSGGVFDPATGNWDGMTPMSVARYGHAAAVDGNGLIYAIGGYAMPNSATEAVEIYDPSAQSWSTGPRLPEPLYGLAAASSAEGHVYVVGGQWCCNNADQVLDVALELTASGWTNLPQKLPFADFALAAATNNAGRLFAFGGYFAGTLGAVAMYDTVSQAWQSAQ
jgi:N-acetylneuraminic acid mutarotase